MRGRHETPPETMAEHLEDIHKDLIILYGQVVQELMRTRLGKLATWILSKIETRLR